MTGRRLGQIGPAVLALVTMIAGCSDLDPSPAAPTPSNVATGDASTSAPGRWSGLRAECPILDGTAAGMLGVTGEGRPTGDYHHGNTLHADCAWGSTDDKGTAINARVSVYPIQQAADATWKVLIAAGPQLIPGLGDQAFSTLEPQSRSVAIRVRSANAVAIIRVTVPAAGPDELTDRLREVEPTAREIAQDVIADLR